MKQFKILFTIFISSLYVSSAYSASLDNIQAVDNKTIKVTASQDVIFSDIKVYGDVRILKDMEISKVSKDPINNRKVTLTLSNDLYLNSTYSLIGVIGAEGNIDFEVNNNFSGEKINPNYYNEDKIMEKVVIIDSKNIEVYYNYDLTSSLYEFKLLSELKVESISSTGNNVLDISLSTSLAKSSSYMLMASGLENIDGKEVVLNSSLYDFTTNSTLIEKTEIINTVEQSTNQQVTNVDSNIEELALNAAETPDSGAETWFVMLLTFIISTFYFTRNRFKKS